MLLRIYAHMICFPNQAHSPSHLLNDVPDLNSKRIHECMNELEEAGVLHSAWVQSSRPTRGRVRIRQYVFTEAGLAYAYQVLGPLQVPALHPGSVPTTHPQGDQTAGGESAVGD